jgi:hypothetical protein
MGQALRCTAVFDPAYVVARDKLIKPAERETDRRVRRVKFDCEETYKRTWSATFCQTMDRMAKEAGL